MQEIFQKRQELYKSIKRQKLQNYMKKIRYQIIEQTNRQQQIQQNHLNQLIQSTVNQVSEQEINQLFDYAHQNKSNAIIHIGNLIIDRVIQKSILEHIQISPKSNEYWSWLIRVLFCQGVLKQQWFEYTLNNISIKKSQFALQNSLQTLKLVLQMQTSQAIPIILSRQSLVLAIKNNTLSQNARTSQLCYEILDLIIEKGDDQTYTLVNTCTLPQIQNVLILCLSKKNQKLQILAIRCINNILSSGFFMHDIYLPCRRICYQTTGPLKIQCSYLWISFVQSINQRTLKMALQNEFLCILQDIYQHQFKKQSQTRIAKSNTQKVISKIIQKIQLLGQKQYVLLINKIKTNRVFSYWYQQNMSLSPICEQYQYSQIHSKSVQNQESKNGLDSQINTNYCSSKQIQIQQ